MHASGCLTHLGNVDLYIGIHDTPGQFCSSGVARVLNIERTLIGCYGMSFKYLSLQLIVVQSKFRIFSKFKLLANTIDMHNRVL